MTSSSARAGPALVHALTRSGNVVLGGLSLFVLAALALVGLLKNRPGRVAEPAAASAQGIR